MSEQSSFDTKSRYHGLVYTTLPVLYFTFDYELQKNHERRSSMLLLLTSDSGVPQVPRTNHNATAREHPLSSGELLNTTHLIQIAKLHRW
jgi:hypothetical protein